LLPFCYPISRDRGRTGRYAGAAASPEGEKDVENLRTIGLAAIDESGRHQEMARRSTVLIRSIVEHPEH
jgi:hypothetical protein